MTTDQKKRIDYKLRVHSVPEDLRLPLAPDRQYLADMSLCYRMAVESRLLWDVWLIDQYKAHWIAVSFENEEGEPEFHTLRVDPATFRKVRCDPYEVRVENTVPPELEEPLRLAFLQSWASLEASLEKARLARGPTGSLD